MAMLMLIFTTTLAIMVGIAMWANRHFHRAARLPMQWGLRGTVNWSAPRVWALSFIPLLAFGFFAFFTLLMLTKGPRDGQENVVIPAGVGMSAMYITIQILHLWGAARTLRRDNP